MLRNVDKVSAFVVLQSDVKFNDINPPSIETLEKLIRGRRSFLCKSYQGVLDQTDSWANAHSYNKVCYAEILVPSSFFNPENYSERFDTYSTEEWYSIARQIDKCSVKPCDIKRLFPRGCDFRRDPGFPQDSQKETNICANGIPNPHYKPPHKETNICADGIKNPHYKPPHNVSAFTLVQIDSHFNDLNPPTLPALEKMVRYHNRAKESLHKTREDVKNMVSEWTSPPKNIKWCIIEISVPADFFSEKNYYPNLQGYLPDEWDGYNPKDKLKAEQIRKIFPNSDHFLSEIMSTEKLSQEKRDEFFEVCENGIENPFFKPPHSAKEEKYVIPERFFALKKVSANEKEIKEISSGLKT